MGNQPGDDHAGSGFANQSVYCPDLMCLIYHVHSIVQADMAPQTWQGIVSAGAWRAGPHTWFACAM